MHARIVKRRPFWHCGVMTTRFCIWGAGVGSASSRPLLRSPRYSLQSSLIAQRWC